MPSCLRSGIGLAWVAWVLTACGGPAYGDAWVRSFNGARRATAAGRYAEAATLYEQASRDALRDKDRDEAWFMQARMMLRLQRVAEARGIFDRMVLESPDGPRAGRARFEQARLAIEAGDEGGWRMLEAAIARHAEHGAARAAVTHWVAHLRTEGGEEQVRAGIDALLPKLKHGEAVQQLEYERAISLDRSGKLADAHAQFLSCARAHPLPHGNLTDDAYWRASLVAEKLSDPAGAIGDLRELLEAREVAWFGQSYERPKYPLAQMRIAELYRDRLRDDRAARDEFRRLPERHPSSILGDDAMWQEGLASVRLREPAEACRTAERLRDRYPHTRYLSCLPMLCPGFSAPKDARECPGYLRVQLDPNAALPTTQAAEPLVDDRGD